VDQASAAAALGKTAWRIGFWAGVEAELRKGEVDEVTVGVLMSHGFSPGRPSQARAPDLPQLRTALEELLVGLGPGFAVAPTPQGHFDDGTSLHGTWSHASWPPPHDIPSATPPRQHSAALGGVAPQITTPLSSRSPSLSSSTRKPVKAPIVDSV